jgi:hypothetical protein
MSHRQQAQGKSDEWYTPPYIFEALDMTFDMDVASPGQPVTPWIPAKVFLTKQALEIPWLGSVWMNPPFGKRGDKAFWLQKFFEHGNGVALVPDRTSAPWWQQYVPRADLVLFVSPKIKFLGPNGQSAGDVPAQGTCLLSIGERPNIALCRAEQQGLGTIMQPY